MALYSIIYASSATHLFSAEELAALLKKTCDRNSRDGVAGMLLYKDGNFMQALEGEEAVVTATLARLSRDPRHHDLIVLARGPVAQREFSDWSMAFSNLDLPGARSMPGYSEFLNTPLTDQGFVGSSSRCLKLLRTFKRTMR